MVTNCKHAISDNTSPVRYKKFGGLEFLKWSALSHFKKTMPGSWICLPKSFWIRRHFRWLRPKSNDDRLKRDDVGFKGVTGLSQWRAFRLIGLSMYNCLYKSQRPAACQWVKGASVNWISNAGALVFAVAGGFRCIKSYKLLRSELTAFIILTRWARSLDRALRAGGWMASSFLYGCT